MRRLLVVLIAVAVGVLAWTRRRARTSVRAEELAAEPADVRFMYAMHNAFRRDLEHLERAVHTPESSREGWSVFREELEFHHHAEDDDLWPELRARVAEPGERKIVDDMVTEHAQIGPALDAVATGFDGHGDLEAAVNGLTRLVREHLEHEEGKALPLVEQHFSNADWHAFLRTERRKRGPKGGAQFICWVLDEANDADAAAVLQEMPPPGRLVYRNVMKPRWDAVQRWAPEAVGSDMSRLEPTLV
jgi:hemerythrin-like domain-containing protein